MKLKSTNAGLSLLACLFAIVAVGFTSPLQAQTVVSVQPANGATEVPLDSSIVFTFSEAVDATTLVQSSTGDIFIGSLNWSANIIQPILNMTPSWSPDFTVLTLTYNEDLPGSSTITWEINPAGSPFFLKENAIGVFPFDNASGSFTTVEGSNCNPDGVPETYGKYRFFKNLIYVQVGASDPVLDAEVPAAASVSIESPAIDPVETATLMFPSGASTSLPSFLNQFVTGGAFDSQAEMDAAYPPGNYRMTMTRTLSPDTVVDMTVPATYPPTPKITNLQAAQSVDPTANFALQWQGFASATGDDLIVLSIEDGDTTVFTAPELCIPIDLPNTATAIQIPAGTLEADKLYGATLTFYKSFYFSTNSPAEFLTTGALAKSTQFTINTGVEVVTPDPQLSAFGFNPQGRFGFTAENLQVGTQYRIEYKQSLIPGAWTLIELVTPTAGSYPFVDNGSSDTAGNRYYRVIKP